MVIHQAQITLTFCQTGDQFTIYIINGKVSKFIMENTKVNICQEIHIGRLFPWECLYWSDSAQWLKYATILPSQSYSGTLRNDKQGLMFYSCAYNVLVGI